MMNPLWTDLAARAGVELSRAQHDALSRYLDLLLEANARMNLTRITDRAAAEVQHVGDALTLLPLLPPGPHRLAAARPDARGVLGESTKKKAAFLAEAVRALGLANVTVVDTRAEDAGRSP